MVTGQVLPVDSGVTIPWRTFGPWAAEPIQPQTHSKKPSAWFEWSLAQPSGWRVPENGRWKPALQQAVARVKKGKPALVDAVTQHR